MTRPIDDSKRYYIKECKICGFRIWCVDCRINQGLTAYCIGGDYFYPSYTYGIDGWLKKKRQYGLVNHEPHIMDIVERKIKGKKLKVKFFVIRRRFFIPS